jgi:hypothetical protein
MEDIARTGHERREIKNLNTVGRKDWIGEGGWGGRNGGEEKKTIYRATHLVVGVQISRHELAKSERERQRCYHQRHYAWVQEPAAPHARQGKATQYQLHGG